MFRGAPRQMTEPVPSRCIGRGGAAPNTGPQGEQAPKGQLGGCGMGLADVVAVNPGNFLLDIRHRRRPGCSGGQRGSFPVSSGRVPTSSYHQHEGWTATPASGGTPPNQPDQAQAQGLPWHPRPGTNTAVPGSRPSQLEDTRGTAKTFNPRSLGFGRPLGPAHGAALPVASRPRRERITDKTPVEIGVGLENQAMPAVSKS